MEKIKISGIIEQHIHGGFGVNFNTCSVSDVEYFLNKIKNYGVTKVYPTLHTDSFDILNNQIKVIYEASKKENDVKIMGIHLEGPFINPKKSGVHNIKDIKTPSIEAYKKITKDINEDFIKIVTIAPELDKNNELIEYLKSKNVVISAGHCLTKDLSSVSQVTHLFNAMGGISHKENSTAQQALINNNIYTELIADGNHIVDDTLKMIFKMKPKEKLILISDALPIAHSKNKMEMFMGQETYLHENCAKTKDGTLAGSAIFVFEIIKRLVNKNLLDFETAINAGSKNIAEHLQIEHASMLYINENFEILD